MENKSNPWKKLSSKIVHENPWFKVRKDQVIKPNGEPGEYNVFITPPAVFVVAMDDRHNVYLIGQYRYPIDDYSLEVPGGGSGKDDPLTAAKKELQEETGLLAKTWEKLGESYPLNGLASEINYFYLATDLQQTEVNEQLEEGIQEVIKVPLNQAVEMIKRGEIKDGQSINAILLAYLHT